MKNLVKVAVAALSLTFLSACASKSEDYQAGYSQGWGYAMGQGDGSLRDKSKDYQKGWRKGYEAGMGH